MDGVGTFSKKLTYIGSLIANDIGNGHFFQTLDPASQIAYRYLAYTGNRVNIYVMDQISAASRSPLLTPGLKFGICVHWGFQARYPQFSTMANGYMNLKIREADWNGAAPVADTALNPVNPLRLSSSATELFGENKIEFGGYVPGGVGLQGLEPRPFCVAEMNPTAYAFPYNADFASESGARNYVIPVVARADFMVISFWCDPITWHGSLATDQVHIWAMSGTDVAGSEKI